MPNLIVRAIAMRLILFTVIIRQAKTYLLQLKETIQCKNKGVLFWKCPLYLQQNLLHF